MDRTSSNGYPQYDPRRRAPAALGHLRLQPAGAPQQPARRRPVGAVQPSTSRGRRPTSSTSSPRPVVGSTAWPTCPATGRWSPRRSSPVTDGSRSVSLPSLEGRRVLLVGLVGPEVLRIAITWSQAVDR
ncbi:hypothetical protein G5V59_00710 [Nocardioides sp. W3-2-3]|uniref:hypothetical protein n=1 Tax=Nocardioides convexus TaxID=2712224 RepID=UPI0024189641|nr:hypothetical protein [Nocardioides convexus]NGZ99458.1 hypothetical protein [Nocardioides convexus]